MNKPALSVSTIARPTMAVPAKPGHPTNLLTGAALKGNANPAQWSAVNAWRKQMGFALVCFTLALGFAPSGFAKGGASHAGSNHPYGQKTHKGSHAGSGKPAKLPKGF